MTRQGYSPHQTRLQLLLLNHLSNWLASEGLVVGELRAKEVEQFQLSRHEAGYSFLRSIRAMQPILGYLRELGIAPAASSTPASGVLEPVLERYRGYLILERGIRNESASRYIDLMRPFLQTKVSPDGLPTVPGQRLTGLPKGLASDQVQRLLASCDTSTRSGRRDFAVLTMLVRLAGRRSRQTST
jgi:site-specific recombinase XerC